MTRFARILRDLCLVGVGLIFLIVTPPSLREVGVYGALSQIWALMIGGGALGSLYGVLRRRVDAEIRGCVFVGVGFAVWAIAAVIQPGANLTSYALALVFLSGTAGQIYRIGMIVERRVIR